MSSSTQRLGSFEMPAFAGFGAIGGFGAVTQSRIDYAAKQCENAIEKAYAVRPGTLAYQNNAPRYYQDLMRIQEAACKRKRDLIALERKERADATAARDAAATREAITTGAGSAISAAANIFSALTAARAQRYGAPQAAPPPRRRRPPPQQQKSGPNMALIAGVVGLIVIGGIAAVAMSG